MRYPELEKHLDDALYGAEKLSAMYVISGEDEFLTAKAAGMFKKLVTPDFADFNLLNIDVSRGMSAVTEALSTFPIMDERKIVIAEGFNNKIDDSELAILVDYLKNPSEFSVLAAVCDSEIAGSLTKKTSAVLVNCNRLAGAELSAEIAKLLAEPPARSLEKNAERELVTAVNGDMSRIYTEIQKLKAYSSSVITAADVNVLVTPDAEYRIFELSNAVSEKNCEKSLKILDAFLKDGTRPMTVLSLLYSQYHKMLHVELHKNKSDAEIGKLLNIKPGGVYHTRQVSQKYTQVKLKKSVDFLHGLQYDIVSGRRTEASAVHDAVLQLLNL